MRIVFYPLMVLVPALLLGACQPKAADKTPEPQAAPLAHPASDAPSPHAMDPHANAPASAMAPHGGTPHPVTPEEEQAAAHGKMDVSSSAKKGSTVVPPEVQGKWKAATFIIVDRERSGAEEVIIPLGGHHDLDGGKLRISAIEFLPDLRIDNNIYTSMSNDPNNPASRVVITEGGKEVFDGWLFAEFPQVHKFEHPRFGITLKEGVPN